eukprot:jgi/Mesvir1/20700/Mv14899-RA.2
MAEGESQPKRKRDGETDGPEKKPATAVEKSAIQSVHSAPTCVHEVCLPEKYDQPASLDKSIHGDINSPIYTGKPAREYPFKLDPFQSTAVACLERGESVLVSAHTSAGKTVVAEYAIAMAFRDKQRVIYTSPIKALSNQKYRDLCEVFDGDVGLMTGDVTLSPNATCLVMTTEILRSMMYRGSDIMREVSWVVFDEIHYMRDRERGVVWEESIMMLPKKARMVFLSATMANANEFARWVVKLHACPCHVVLTQYRPTPLQHYVFPKGGTGLYLVVDERGNFREDNFNKLAATFEKEEAAPGGAARGGAARGGRGGRGRGGGGRGGANGTVAPEEKGKDDMYKIIKMISEKKLYPVIVFSFSRRECENYGGAMFRKKMDFNTEEEKEMVEEVFTNAVSCLAEGDRDMAAITELLPILKRGIGVHHSGLLPLLKEVVEILFQEGLIKALFATETFAMGLNMPARTVVFTKIQKWDGEASRFLTSGEYIQMSGRAGRRGMDEKGLCILMAEADLEMETCRNMMLGKPEPLMSTFHLSYYTLLNLMVRADGEMNALSVIQRSFHQFQHELNLPEVEKKIEEHRQKAAAIKLTGEDTLREYDALRTAIREQEKVILAAIFRPDRCLHYLRPGRLVRVRNDVDWGWGIVVSVVRKNQPVGSAQQAAQGAPGEVDLSRDAMSAYTVDILLRCSTGEGDGRQGAVPRPARRDEKGEMHVLPVPLQLLVAMSSIKLALPGDLRPLEARQSVQLALQEVHKKFHMGIPLVDPIQDMEIDDPSLVAAVREVERLEAELVKNPIHKMQESHSEKLSLFEMKADHEAAIKELKAKIRSSHLQQFKEELRSRTRVLKRLGCVDEEGIVQLKGRAACLIDTADELLATELMFEGAFNDLDKHQAVALASCLIPVEKSNEEVRLKANLDAPLKVLQDTARHIAKVSKECGLELDEQTYVESFKPTLMDVVYKWSTVRRGFSS